MSNCLIVGMLAKIIKSTEPWYIRDGVIYKNNVKLCEKLKKQYMQKSLLMSVD